MVVRALVAGLVIILLWQLVVSVTSVPGFILPSPVGVFSALIEDAAFLAPHAGITALEIVLGLVIGTVLGSISAILMIWFRPIRTWLFPVLVISQALPVFALAPILVLWLGYGLASKIAMAVMIIFFPVTAALYDGLRRTDPGLLDLARTMGADSWALLRHIRIPAALPVFASGLRVATAVAPIGAVVGEWVGSSAGLGYLMLHWNARMQVDSMFAALVVLAALAVSLYFLVDHALRRLTYWQTETDMTKG